VILTLLRTHKYEDDNTMVAVGHVYPFKSSAKVLPGVDEKLISDAISGASKETQLKQIIQDTVSLGTVLIEHSLLQCKLPADITKEKFGK
jgi:hypothetical protein